MAENPKSVGERSEGLVLAALLRARKVVLQPFGDNQRYDLVVDEGGVFIRIQCKTGRLKLGGILFDTCSSQAHRGRGKFGYKGQADLFAVYCPDLDKVFMVPVRITGDRGCILRVDPPKNGQRARVRMAQDYELGHRDLATLL